MNKILRTDQRDLNHGGCLRFAEAFLPRNNLARPMAPQQARQGSIALPTNTTVAVQAICHGAVPLNGGVLRRTLGIICSARFLPGRIPM